MKTGNATKLLVSALAALSLMCVQARAQTKTTAGITGFVTDPSALPIAEATVTLTNTLTGLTRTVQTTSEGLYTLAQLPSGGGYGLEISKTGFRTYKQSGISLEVNQMAQVNVTLQLGAVAEVVEVTGAAPLLETQTSDVGEVVGGRRLTELPINGRNPLALVGLVAGVTTFSAPSILGDFRAGATASVNGNRVNANNYQFDGNNFSSKYFNTALNYPNPDALEEFRVITHNYSAEFGRNAGAVTNAITKAGSNEFHGAAWEFLRDQHFNARSFFAARPAKLKWNQFGGTAGGRIISGKLFYFGSYQGLRIPGEALITNQPVATQAMRNGDFSALATPIIDPQTGLPFPGNIIPQNRLNPITVPWYNTYVPLPSNPDGRTFNAFGPAPQRNHQLTNRMDYQVNQKHLLTGRWFYDWTQRVAPFDYNPLPGYAPRGVKVVAKDVSINETWNISPTLLNQAHFGTNRVAFRDTIDPGSKDLSLSNSSLGINFPDQAKPVYGPVFFISGDVSSWANPGSENGENWNAYDTLTWIRGKHSFKFGMEMMVDTYHNNVTPFSQGAHTFNGTFTGNGVADFFLGQSAEFTAWSPIIQNSRAKRYSPFVQDDFKVSRRLTLNLGFRWEINGPPVQWRDDFVVKHPVQSWIPGQQSTTVPLAPIGLNYVGDPGVPQGLYKTPMGNFEPRIGFAWDPTGSGKWAIRGGYGLFADVPPADTLTYTAVAQPYQLFGTPVRSPVGGVADPYLNVPQGNPFPYDTSTTRFYYPVTVHAIDQNFEDARIQQFHISVQRAFGRDILLNVAYVGNRADNLLITAQLNPATFIPGNDPVTGQPLSTNANLDSRRIILPGTFADIRQAQSKASASFDSLQVTFEKRWTSGFMFLSAYTWSHAIDETSNFSYDGTYNCQNPFNCDERGNAGFDRRHVFVTSLNYDLAHGWQIGAILRATTGAPFTIGTGQSRALMAGGGERPNLVGDPLAGVNRNSRESSIKAWFNTAAFALNNIGTVGNLGRNTMFGPSFYNADFSVFKNFVVSEKYGRVQFRSEIFNLFNTPNLGGPNGNLSSPSFGKLTGSGPGRVIQFALKYLW